MRPQAESVQNNCQKLYTVNITGRSTQHLSITNKSCADPESFVRGGPNLIPFFFLVEGIEDPNTAINGPVKRHWNGVSLAGRWWPNFECWLGSYVILQGIRTYIAKKPYIFVIFQGGPDHLSPPHLDPPMQMG